MNRMSKCPGPLLIGGSLIKADGDFAGDGVSRGVAGQSVHACNALTGGTIQCILEELFGKLHVHCRPCRRFIHQKKGYSMFVDRGLFK